MINAYLVRHFSEVDFNYTQQKKNYLFRFHKCLLIFCHNLAFILLLQAIETH